MEKQKQEMPPKYNPKETEAKWYSYWVEGKFFEAAGDETKEPYSIVIPPPNVTGKLHLGHAWDATLQDILARTKRMQGYDTLWLPGMDHAGMLRRQRSKESLERKARLGMIWDVKPLSKKCGSGRRNMRNLFVSSGRKSACR